MLLALRSLYEPEVIPPVVPPVGFGGGGGQVHFRPIIPPKPVAATVTFRPARFKARAGKLIVTAGSNVTLQSIRSVFVIGKLEASGAATVQTESATSTFRLSKITAIGVDNDPAIAMSLLDL